MSIETRLTRVEQQLGQFIRNGERINQLLATTGIVDDLTVGATLTLGAGGRIQDADGSYWDQGGIVLAAPDTLGDVIRLQRTGYASHLALQSYVAETVATASLVGVWTDGVTQALGAVNVSPASLDEQGSLSLNLIGPSGAQVHVDLSTLEIISLYEGNGVTGGLNLRINSSFANFGNGQGVVFLGDRAAAPTLNPSGGGYLYAESGALKWRGSSGTVTTIAAA